MHKNLNKNLNILHILKAIMVSIDLHYKKNYKFG